MLDKVEWLGHSSIKILGSKIIYIDPYGLKEGFYDADIIFITHSHYDHFSPEDIKKCQKASTKIIIPNDLSQDVLKLGFQEKNIVKVFPDERYEVAELNFMTIPAYNVGKEYHPKTNGWVGYVIDMDGVRYYIAGDTDITNEAKEVKCDVAFLPIGGTFTMDYQEAATLANEIRPKVVVPIHYGSLVGTEEDALNFKSKIEDRVECKILK